MTDGIATSRNAFDGFGIDGNKSAFGELVDLLRSKKAIAFVGAGVSYPLYPLWEEVLGHLVAKAREHGFDPTGLSDEDDPQWVVEEVRRAIGDEGTYRSILSEMFGPRTGDDGRAFTETHARLLRLPFAGYVTTNYDDGLYEARRHCWPTVPFAQVTTPKNTAALQAWLSGKALEQNRPILSLHGHHFDPSSIVLHVESYRSSYLRGTLFQKVFGRLWCQEQLIFVGYGFADTWNQFQAEREITESLKRETEGFRHIAIIGELEERLAHKAWLDGQRRKYMDRYRARVLFYPIRNGSHESLGELLDALFTLVGKAESSLPLPGPSSSAKPLDAWFDQVVDTHSRLVDCFDRPGQLGATREAWVELHVRAAEVEAGSTLRSKAADSAAQSGNTNPQSTLEEILAIDRQKTPWIGDRWLLEGFPGSGKTTMLRHLALRLAETRDHGRIPLFVSLPQVVGQSQSWLMMATEAFRTTHGPEILQQLELAGEEGHLVVLLDGLDELPPERRPAAKALWDHLRLRWPDCPVVLSTRPLGAGNLPDGYSKLRLLPLTRQRQLEFIKKWFEHGGMEKAEAENEAELALAYFSDDPGIADLATVPLYLTLLVLLWLDDGRIPDRMALLYDEIFDFLLEGRHRQGAPPIPAQDDVRATLRQLAFDLTEEEIKGESPVLLEKRLRESTFDEVRSRLETVSDWRNNLRRFLEDVFERTQILGPHDGKDGDWRFWHRTFREALAAEHLHHRFDGDVVALAEWVRDLPEGDEEKGRSEGRWAETLALLAGRLDEPDELIARLASVKPQLVLRSMTFTEGLRPDTLARTIGLTSKQTERMKVFERVPDQLADPYACLQLVEQLKRTRPGGFDLFWLHWILDRVEIRWPGFARQSRIARRRLFDFISAPAPSLFATVDSALDGQVKLWCEIPEGESFLGSPNGAHGSNQLPRHAVKLTRAFQMSAVTVTNSQYAAFDPSRADASKPNHPVVGIDWYEAMAFCRWLASLDGFGGARLPTEEEWEYACRAGTETHYWKGNSESDLAEVGWYGEGFLDSTHPVAEKAANPWGLYDVHGSSYEWTLSPWARRVDTNAHPITNGVLDPMKPSVDLSKESLRDERVLRGGSCWVVARDARSAHRFRGSPWYRDRNRGFRVLLPRPPSGG